MPPTGAKQPSAVEKRQFLATLTQQPVPHTTLRRLNRREYINTVGDLFGINHAGNRSAIYVTYADFDRPGLAWRLEDRAAGLTVEVRTSADFLTMVHWSPPDRSVVSPVIATSLANGFNLRARISKSSITDVTKRV